MRIFAYYFDHEYGHPRAIPVENISATDEFYVVDDENDLIETVLDGEIVESHTIREFIARQGKKLRSVIPDMRIAKCEHGFFWPVSSQDYLEWECPECAMRWYCEHECPTQSACLHCPQLTVGQDIADFLTNMGWNPGE